MRGPPLILTQEGFGRSVRRHNVTLFYTAPTAIRALMKLGDDIPNNYDLSALRLLGTVGEPINPEAWMWYHTIIGKERVSNRRHLVANRNRSSHD